MIRWINTYLSKRSKSYIITLGILLAFLIGAVGIVTGYEISFSIFYLLPILMVAWFAGKRPGMAMSVLSACIWLFADLMSGHRYAHIAISIWNAVLYFAIFVMITYFMVENRRLFHAAQDLARTDPLTGVPNSRELFEVLERELRRAGRSGKPFTFAYVDIDDFKEINDTRGHGEGDALLVTAATTMQQHIREIDSVGRLGGDEFVIILPETDEQEARRVIGRIQEHLLVAVRTARWPVTFSFGVITCYDAACGSEDIIRKADALLYDSKRHGKNQVTYGLIGRSDGTPPERGSGAAGGEGR